LFHEIDHTGRNVVEVRQSVTYFLMHAVDFGPRIYAVVEATRITTTLERIVPLHSLCAASEVVADTTMAVRHPSDDLGCDGAKRKDIGGEVDAIGSGLQEPGMMARFRGTVLLVAVTVQIALVFPTSIY